MATWVSQFSSGFFWATGQKCDFLNPGDAAVEGIVGGKGVEQPTVAIPGLALVGFHFLGHLFFNNQESPFASKV